jgi:hypothetical protein
LEQTFADRTRVHQDKVCVYVHTYIHIYDILKQYLI